MTFSGLSEKYSAMVLFGLVWTFLRMSVITFLSGVEELDVLLNFIKS